MIFAVPKPEIMYETGRAFTYLLLAPWAPGQ